jgi:transposase-like protein
MSDIVCKYCQSQKVRKYGKYNNVQLYYCNECKRKFTPNDSLFHMHTPNAQVSTALDMYYTGSSINTIRRHLNQEHENTPSSATVFEWINKYTDEAIKEVVNQIAPGRPLNKLYSLSKLYHCRLNLFC